MKRIVAGAIIAASVAVAAPQAPAHEGSHTAGVDNQILYGPSTSDPKGLRTFARCREGGIRQRRAFRDSDGAIGYDHFKCQSAGSGRYWLLLWR